MPWFQVTYSIDDRLVVETFAENRKVAKEKAKSHINPGSFCEGALQLEDCTEIPEAELANYIPEEGRII